MFEEVVLGWLPTWLVQVVEAATGRAVLGGQADRLNTGEGRLRWSRGGVKEAVALPHPCYSEVVEQVCEVAEREEWGLVGHR